eukprot:2059815-Prymnesium_polylepis.2
MSGPCAPTGGERVRIASADARTSGPPPDTCRASRNRGQGPGQSSGGSGVVRPEGVPVSVGVGRRAPRAARRPAGRRRAGRATTVSASLFGLWGPDSRASRKRGRASSPARNDVIGLSQRSKRMNAVRE